MRFRVTIAVGLLIAACVISGAQQRPTSTIKDIMGSMIDPSADYLWEAVSTQISPNGDLSTRAPRSAQAWQNARRQAITLIEASNLLLIPGRHVAKPGDKSEQPGIELEPAQIEKLIADNPVVWTDLSHGMQDVATKILAAIEAKDAGKLENLGAELDEACERCHLKFWYPSAGPPALLIPGR